MGHASLTAGLFDAIVVGSADGLTRPLAQALSAILSSRLDSQETALPPRFSFKRMEQFRIGTERLELVAMDCARAVAQIEDRIGFFNLLGVRPTADWPPPLVDMDAMSFTRDRLTQFPDEIGWQAWVWIDPVETPWGKELVGFGGFSGQPDDEGAVEIGYSVLPSREGFGYASEAVAALIDWAKSDCRVRTIVAHTMEKGVASQRLLQKQGFALMEKRPSPDVLRWERAT